MHKLGISIMDNQFLVWLSGFLNTSEKEAQKLLENELSRYFLIVWSIYEAKCFNGFVQIKKMKQFVDKIEKSIDPKIINDDAKYFHKRYGDKEKYRHLIYKGDNSKFREIINKKYSDLTVNEKIYLLAFVTYRYRNNIFHGSKGIESWLRFDEQIKKCIQILQIFISAKLTTA